MFRVPEYALRFSACQASTRNLGANFGAHFGENFGKFVSSFASFFGNFVLSGPVRDTPPYRAIPFRDSIAEGGIAPICLGFIGYLAKIAEIPLLRGAVSHLNFACSQRGNCSEKAEGVSHPIGHVETPKTP